MIGNLDDFLIVLLVGILLFAGDKNSAGSLKNLLKSYNEFKKKRDELILELRRELNEVTEEAVTPVKEVSSSFRTGINEINNTYNEARNNFQDVRAKLLEERIKEIEEELKKLKKQQSGSGNK